jgi:predicted PurR-regulated permease PerM
LLAFGGDPLDVLWLWLPTSPSSRSSNLLEPLVMEKAASIHPSAVILAVTTLGSAFRVF